LNILLLLVAVEVEHLLVVAVEVLADTVQLLEHQVQTVPLNHNYQ
jgi:hypothetical protein